MKLEKVTGVFEVTTVENFAPQHFIIVTFADGVHVELKVKTTNDPNAWKRISRLLEST